MMIEMNQKNASMVWNANWAFCVQFDKFEDKQSTDECSGDKNIVKDTAEYVVYKYNL